MFSDADKAELKKIGNRLKKVRQDLNLLQKDMSINKNQYSGYEQGLNAMNILTLKQICIELQCSADFILDIKNEFNELSKDKQAIWYVIKNLSDDKVQMLKGMLIFLNQN